VQPVVGGVNWTPLGPAAINHGQATFLPIVSGRITALAVGPGGQRIYAGAANGGVWFSADAGKTWAPLDQWAHLSTAPSDVEADSLAVGAIAVLFGTALDGSADTLFVGTGEPVGSNHTVEVAVEVFPTSALIRKGHRLRVSVGTSDFPHGLPPLPRLVTQLPGLLSIHSDAAHASSVVLPIVPTAELTGNP